MKCKNCSNEISFNTTRCVICGAVQEPIILRITPEEAKEGCKKRVHAPFMANTILVSLQPGVRKGTTFQLQNAQILYEDGETKTEPVYVRVSVGKIRGGQYAYKKKKIVWPWILLASILLLAGAFVFLLSQGFFSLGSQMPTEEPSTEPSVEQVQTEPTTTAPKVYWRHKNQGAGEIVTFFTYEKLAFIERVSVCFHGGFDRRHIHALNLSVHLVRVIHGHFQSTSSTNAEQLKRIHGHGARDHDHAI